MYASDTESDHTFDSKFKEEAVNDLFPWDDVNERFIVDHPNIVEEIKFHVTSLEGSAGEYPEGTT